jgi:hypothetical protein
MAGQKREARLRAIGLELTAAVPIMVRGRGTKTSS